MRLALVPVLVLVALLGGACSSGDDDGDRADAPDTTGPPITAVAGEPGGTEQEIVAASEFCSNLGPGGIEDLLGTAPTSVRATDTSCEWSETIDGSTRELSVTLTPHPTDADAIESVSADDDGDPQLDGFAASAVTFSEKGDVGQGEVQVASGPAVLTFTAVGPGLTRSGLTAGVAAVLQG